MDPGVIATALLGSAVVSALVTAVLGHWNEMSKAREERRQTRLAETYTDLLKLVLFIGDRAAAIDPERSPGTRSKILGAPPEEEQRALRARLSAYGSPAMRQAYLDLLALDSELMDAVKALSGLLQRAKDGGEDSGEQLKSARVKVADQSGQVRGGAVVLIELANAELAERRLAAWERLRSRLRRTKPSPTEDARKLAGLR